ncbi:hypothetical protein D5086_016361 [Populus alba]|uniref:Uncharacterized protein n=1 Tax=Populus alba TaxID=43335 RepID=A0ACC4BTS2_POPAL
MYVTRPLSMYLRDPSALSSPPPEGPNSGVLQAGQQQVVHMNRVLFIPVPNQPLSSNQYYVVERKGKHKGSFNRVTRSETSVGLRMEIVEGMKWVQGVGGASGDEREVRVKREEVFDGKGRWRRFGCYVLVERFALKRMDGSLLLTYDFRHPHRIRSGWEL